MTKLKDLVATLYAELEEIEQDHDELTDTDVREALHVALNYYFVWDAFSLENLKVNVSSQPRVAAGACAPSLNA